MSKRSTQARRASKQRARARRQHGNPPVPPHSQAETADLFGRMIRYVQSADSPEQAVAAARADLRASAGEVARLACGLDLITVVSAARVEMIMDRAATGTEPAAALLELIGLALACRDSQGDAAPPTAAEPEFLPSAVLAAAQEALEIGRASCRERV